MYDVAVVGGGISGCMAALSAARYGARVLLIERYGFLGGTLTACGTGPMMTFHAGETQVIQGVTGELIDRLKKKGLSPGHIFDTTGYTYTVTPFSAEGMKCELEEMLLEAGVKLLYHSIVCDVKYDGEKINEIEIYTKDGKKIIKAHTFVDASGDGDLYFLAGLKHDKGREKDGKCQPMSMNFKLTGIDTEAVKEYIMKSEDEFPRLKGDLKKVTRAPRLSIGGYVKTFEKAKAEGKISFEREDILFFETDKVGEFIVNTTRITDKDPTKAPDLTDAEILGRRQAREVHKLLLESVPGFENSKLEFTGPFIGIRSSRQLSGCYTITAEDIVSCRKFDDTIACGGYPIDIHSPDGSDSEMYEETKLSLKYGDIYNIPYRALITNEAKNLVVVGRCIAASFEAQAAIRVSPNAGAIGQAGGTAAAICAKQNKNTADIDIRELQSALINAGAYLKI